jgi:hypothetical protein
MGVTSAIEVLAQSKSDGGSEEMKKFAILALVIVGGMLFAAGCGGGSSSSSTAQLRVVNAVSDSLGYDYLVGGTTFTTDLPFGQSGVTPYTQISSGAQTFEVRNTGTSADLMDISESFTGGDNFTFVTVGLNTQVSGVLFTDQTTAAASGDVQIRVINASTALGPMDVYLTASTTNLYQVTANAANVQFGSATSYLTLPAATYLLRITVPGQKSPYLESSLTYTSGAVLTIIIEDQTGGGLPLNEVTLTDVAAAAS